MSEWDFYLNGTDTVAIGGAYPTPDPLGESIWAPIYPDVSGAGLSDPAFVAQLNAGLPYGAHIQPREVGVLEPGGTVLIGTALEYAVASLPPAQRAEAADQARRLWTAEAASHARPGATHAYLNAIAPQTVIGAATDPYPPEARPDWLKPFAHVTGTIPSAPLDLASRMDRVVNTLRSAGWTPVVRSIGTDFQGPLGMPVPKDQPLDMLLHRTDRSYTIDEAQTALKDAIKDATNVYFSPTGAWLTELTSNIAIPTITQAAQQAHAAASEIDKLIPWLAVGIASIVAIQAMPMIKDAYSSVRARFAK